jgi:hypothetical protein
MVAAERLGLPYATVLVIAAGSFVRKQVVGEPLNALRAAHGLPPDHDLTMLSRYLVLSPFPPSYRDPAFPLPATAHTLRPLAPACRGCVMRGWRLPDVPTSTSRSHVFNLESGDLFERARRLRACPSTSSPPWGEIDQPSSGRNRPTHIGISPVGDPAALRGSRSHGGSGSVGRAGYGLLWSWPHGADQPLNAARCQALGVARVLDAVQATPATVREAVATVLADPAYRRAAERLRDEIAAQPEPAQAGTLLERLVDRTGLAIAWRARPASAML